MKTAQISLVKRQTAIKGRCTHWVVNRNWPTCILGHGAQTNELRVSLIQMKATGLSLRQKTY